MTTTIPSFCKSRKRLRRCSSRTSARADTAITGSGSCGDSTPPRPRVTSFWAGAACKGIDFYVRQLRDMKGSADLANQSADQMTLYAELCGHVLARAHARTGDAAMISGYLGNRRRVRQGDRCLRHCVCGPNRARSCRARRRRQERQGGGGNGPVTDANSRDPQSHRQRARESTTRHLAGHGDVRAGGRHVDHERVDLGRGRGSRHDGERCPVGDRARGACLRRVHPDQQQSRRPHRPQTGLRARSARLCHRRVGNDPHPEPDRGHHLLGDLRRYRRVPPPACHAIVDPRELRREGTGEGLRAGRSGRCHRRRGWPADRRIHHDLPVLAGRVSPGSWSSSRWCSPEVGW